MSTGLLLTHSLKNNVVAGLVDAILLHYNTHVPSLVPVVINTVVLILFLLSSPSIPILRVQFRGSVA